MIHREEIEWCDIWVTGADAAGRPRLLLAGDSITRSYYGYVRERLSDRYAVARFATSKCVADPAFFRELELVLAEHTFARIHFNNGLHGWGYDEGAYAAGLARALDRLLAHGGAGSLTWGSTTPVWEAGRDVLAPRTARVRDRNRLAAELARERGLPINDLFAAVVDRPELVSKDGIHFLEAGEAVLGRCVVDALEAR
jgi:hypothetical protein